MERSSKLLLYHKTAIIGGAHDTSQFILSTGEGLPLPLPVTRPWELGVEPPTVDSNTGLPVGFAQKR